MKKNVIAILLSVSLIAGSFGAAPLYAAEVTAQEAESEQDLASVLSEEESPAVEEERTEENLYEMPEDSTEVDLNSSEHGNNDVDEDDQNSNEGSSDEEGVLPDYGVLQEYFGKCSK